jgi:multicomponent Na+:H+ antiporter subunit F
MSWTTTFLHFCINIALILLVLAFLMAVFRLIKGPTLPDRILALDLLVAIGIGFIAVIALKTNYPLYLDVAIALGLVGFLATVAFARFILEQSKDTRGSLQDLDGNNDQLPKGESL